MKKILVPIDFSDNSVNALDYAVKLARDIRGDLTLFNSYPIDVPMGVEFSSGIYMRTLHAEVKYDRETRLQQLVDEYKDVCYRFSDEPIAMSIEVKDGPPTESILNMAEENGFELIIMGTKGATGLEEVLLGSITASVIEESHVPVLAIPEGAQFSGLKKVVYATDFDANDVEVLDSIKEMADVFGAEVTCLHINTQMELVEEKRQKMNVLKANTYPQASNVRFQILEGRGVESSLQQYIEQNHVDMVAVMPQKRGFISNLFHRSISKKLAYHTQIPLMVAKF